MGFPLGHQTIIKKRPQEGNKTQTAGAATVRVCALSLWHRGTRQQDDLSCPQQDRRCSTQHHKTRAGSKLFSVSCRIKTGDKKWQIRSVSAWLVSFWETVYLNSWTIFDLLFYNERDTVVNTKTWLWKLFIFIFNSTNECTWMSVTRIVEITNKPLRHVSAHEVPSSGSSLVLAKITYECIEMRKVWD